MRPPDIDRAHPLGGQMSDVLSGVARRIPLAVLAEHHTSIWALALFATFNGFLSITVMALGALITHTPLLFPSLGPTAFLFFYTPMAAVSAPRNAFLGHLVGAVAGYVALLVCGLEDIGPMDPNGPFLVTRVLAAGLSLGLTSGGMVLLRAPHPPAGATTLIISLGILTHPWQLAVLMLAVLLLTGQAFVINRLAGIPYPAWAPRART